MEDLVPNILCGNDMSVDGHFYRSAEADFYIEITNMLQSNHSVKPMV